MQPTESTQMAQLLRKLDKQCEPMACHPTDLSVLAQHSDVKGGDNEKENPQGLLTETPPPHPPAFQVSPGAAARVSVCGLIYAWHLKSVVGTARALSSHD